MHTQTWKRWLALLLSLSLLAVACGGSDSDSDSSSGDSGDTSSEAADTGSDDDDAMADESDDDDAMADDGDDDAMADDGDDDAMADEGDDDAMADGGDDDAMADGGAFDLASVCPDPLVIQTDWFPESEHGALYQMVGEGYTIDADNLVVSGPLWAPGPTPAGIDIEVRTGGPAIGFAPPRVQMYTDDSIHIGYENTESQALSWNDLPLISVMAPLEKNPQMIQWDGDEHPDVATIADLGAKGVTINIFGGGTFADYFVAQGIWSADQIDPSYDGSPARFVSEPSIAQQGFASAEPYNYLNVFEEYGKQVEYQLLHDAGFEIYSQTLAVKPTDFDDLTPCLEKFIPIVQQSVVDFASDPARANAIIIDTVTTYDSFWVYDEGIAEYSVATMSELGLHGNGPDSTVGNIETARVQKVLDDGRTAGLDIPDDLTADDLFTNQFIDDSIGFPDGFGGGAAADAGADEEASAPDYDLSSVCPSPIVIQTDWFPESEHGALYQMVGEGYSIDADNLTVTGPLWAPGPTPAGVDIQVRTGGPAIGFAPPRVQMYTDDSIHIGYSNTESQATAFGDLPLISVMAPLEKNPQMIMWDADAHPDVETIADLGEKGVTINIFGGGGFSDYFVAEGIWSADQIDPSYDGSPARFVSDPTIAQQGFASAEPYNYLNVFEEYGKQVEFQLLHDAGFPVYSQTLAVIPDRLEELRPCLEKFIPIVQQSVVDFSSDPARANATIIDAVTTFDSFWVYDEGIAEYSVATMTELGLHGNGPDDTVGNMEAARIQGIIDGGRAAGLEIPDDLVAEDMFTNEFIDESIGF